MVGSKHCYTAARMEHQYSEGEHRCQYTADNNNYDQLKEFLRIVVKLNSNEPG